MTSLEMQLVEIMVKIVVRYPDGLERIQSCLLDVVEAGAEMALEHGTREPGPAMH
jgi:hypothetical protein